MKIGNNIKAYREKLGLTQKELAEKLFVSPQAISRYENDEVEPNLDMIEKMSDVFSCSMEKLVHGESEKKKPSNQKDDQDVNIIINEEEKKESTKTRGTIICHDCHRAIREGEGTHTAKRRVDGATAEVVICNDCYEAGLELDKKREDKQSEVKANSKPTKKKWMKTVSGGKSLVAGIIVGVISFIVIMALGFTIWSKHLNPGAVVGLSFLALYGMLTLIYCIFSETYITEMFVDIATASVHVPVYFVGHLLDGDVVILIPLKIMGGIISAVIGVFIFGFALALSMICSMVSFPFIAISRIGKED